MNDIIEDVPFVVTIALLVIGVEKRRRFLFIASFPLLLGACAYSLAAEGSSAAFNTMGIYFLLFGIACLVLSRRLQPGSFVSRSGLGSIGALFLVLGVAGMMIV